MRLRMRRVGGVLPEVALPTGVALRTFVPGDRDDVCRLLETGTFGAWPAERFDALFTHAVDHLEPDSVHIAVAAGRVIGHCCLMVRDEPEGRVGKLGWVATHPNWRGRGIGRAVCVEALRDAERRGLGTVVLDTENFRG
ncbi:MAG: GNAT family N-acetyltransferase, partial [Armatimonadota bacterium]